MITLHQADRAFGLPSASPFCTKLELYLRATGEKYDIKGFDPFKAPKGKMPYILDGDRLIGDSSLIIAHLKSSRGETLDKSLSDESRAVGHAVQRMLEESTYFCTLHLRWAEDRNWISYKETLFGAMPVPLKLFLPNMFRKKVIKTLKLQGIGRHSKAEIDAKQLEDMRSVAAILGGKLYLLGDSLTSYDCCVFAFVAGTLKAPFESPARQFIAANKALCDYVARIEKKYLADLAK